MDARRFLKTVIGLVVVIGLLALVLNWWGDYRAAQSTSGAKTKETTATPAPSTSSEATTDATAPEPQTETATKTVLVVQVAGLNLRQEPSGASTAYRGLKKGEKVVLISQEGDWYKVQDANGVVGYITANPAYTKKSQ